MSLLLVLMTLNIFHTLLHCYYCCSEQLNADWDLAFFVVVAAVVE